LLHLGLLDPAATHGRRGAGAGAVGARGRGAGIRAGRSDAAGARRRHLPDAALRSLLDLCAAPDYDCRIFAAAGLDAGGADKAVINRRVRAWRFSYEGEAERRSHDAVRTAARFIRERPEAFSALGVRVPAGPMGIAVLAIKAHAALLDPAAPADDAGRARAMIAAGRAYDGG